VLNLDDPFGGRLLATLSPQVRAIGYSLRPEAPLLAGLAGWLHATEVRPLAPGLRLRFAGSFGEGEVLAPLLGRFNAANLLAVAAVLLEWGMPATRSAARLGRVQQVPGRVEPLGGGDRPLVVVDYAHTPDALEQVLTALREHTQGHLWCLFGCGGDRDRGKRPRMGAIAERLADRVVLTDDNPRSEDGGEILREILAGIADPSAVRVQRDRALAIRQTLAAAAPGDLVLVAGKGHECSQQVGDRKLPFSDREVVLQALGRSAA
jgi:UDP-N-acetylmuramoyl-L-alanyl-D-glutamate--2,6-diaminopimelate ligase